MIDFSFKVLLRFFYFDINLPKLSEFSHIQGGIGPKITLVHCESCVLCIKFSQLSELIDQTKMGSDNDT